MLDLYKGYTGKVLVSVSEEGLFGRTVIYVIKHKVWYAYGVVLNRPLEPENMNRAFPEMNWNVSLYDGGPVAFAEDNYMLLPEQEPASIRIVPTKAMPKRYPEIYDAMEKNLNSEPMNLFLGYAGWGPMQLNSEIQSKGWYVINSDPELLYHTPPEQIWEEANKRVDRRYRHKGPLDFTEHMRYETRVEGRNELHQDYIEEKE